MREIKGKRWLLVFLAGFISATEHLVTYGYYDFELIGHETYGFVAMFVGLFLFWYENLRIKKFVIDSKGMEPDNDQ